MQNKKKLKACRIPILIALLQIWSSSALAYGASLAKDFLANGPNATNRIIVHMRPGTIAANSIHTRINQLAGAPLVYKSSTGSGSNIYQLKAAMPLVYVRQVAARIANDTNVLYAEPDIKLHAPAASRPLTFNQPPGHITKTSATSPNDPLYSYQWNLHNTVAGINAPAAWQLTTGSNAIVIADLSSGTRFDHEDMQGRQIPGYDFVDHDTDPTDPGGIDTSNNEPTATTDPTSQGQGEISVMVANSNNGIGMVGVNWVSKTLAIRIADQNGNGVSLSSFGDAIRWAAGVSVPGLPTNKTPARVILITVGGLWDQCPQEMQGAISDVRARGIAVIVSAGVDDLDTSKVAPDNCQGVIDVTAVDEQANKEQHSSYGSSITIAAPGNNIVAANMFQSHSPGPVKNYTMNWGTGPAAAQVAGVVSLMLSVNPNLSPDDIARLLKQSARPFPPGSTCAGICGAGMLDAGKAVTLADAQKSSPSNPPSTGQPQPLHVLISRAQVVRTGMRVNLIGIGRTAPGRHIVSYLWRQVSGPAVRLSNTHVARPYFIAPRTPASLVFHLIVTDSLGRQVGAATQVRVVTSGHAAKPQPVRPQPVRLPFTPQQGNHAGSGSYTPIQFPNLGNFPIKFPSIKGQPLVQPAK